MSVFIPRSAPPVPRQPCNPPARSASRPCPSLSTLPSSCWVGSTSFSSTAAVHGNNDIHAIFNSYAFKILLTLLNHPLRQLLAVPTVVGQRSTPQRHTTSHPRWVADNSNSNSTRSKLARWEAAGKRQKEPRKEGRGEPSLVQQAYTAVAGGAEEELVRDLGLWQSTTRMSPILGPPWTLSLPWHRRLATARLSPPPLLHPAAKCRPRRCPSSSHTQLTM